MAFLLRGEHFRRAVGVSPVKGTLTAYPAVPHHLTPTARLVNALLRFFNWRAQIDRDGRFVFATHDRLLAYAVF